MKSPVGFYGVSTRYIPENYVFPYIICVFTVIVRQRNPLKPCCLGSVGVLLSTSLFPAGMVMIEEYKR